MGIYDKLLAIQSELHAPKGQHNDYGNYYFRSCEDILEAVKPICQKYGTVLTLVDDVAQVGTRYYIKATARLVDIETGEAQEARAYAREGESKKGMDDSQVSGSASSYARKYALNGLFCIDDAKDADTNAYTAQTRKEQKNTNSQRNANPAPPPKVVKCKDCQKPITDVTWANGTQTSAKTMVNKTVQRYGVPLCGDCYTLRRAKEQTDGNQG